MKKLILLTVIIICALHVTAQTTDTVRKTAAKPAPAQVRMVGGAQMSSANDVITNLSKSKNHGTFVSLITAAGLTETLQNKKGIYTVFAPTDDAFKKLQPGVIDTLLKPNHLTELTRQVSYYIIPDKLTAADIARQIKAGNGEAMLTTLSGDKLTAKINSDRNIVLADANGNQAIVSQFNIIQKNGILDVVTGVLTPKAN